MIMHFIPYGEVLGHFRVLTGEGFRFLLECKLYIVVYMLYSPLFWPEKCFPRSSVTFWITECFTPLWLSLSSYSPFSITHYNCHHSSLCRDNRKQLIVVYYVTSNLTAYRSPINLLYLAGFSIRHPHPIRDIIRLTRLMLVACID